MNLFVLPFISHFSPLSGPGDCHGFGFFSGFSLLCLLVERRHPWTSVDPIERTGASTNDFWEMIGECRKQLSLEAVVQVGVRALEPCDSGDRATGWDHSLDHSGCVW